MPNPPAEDGPYFFFSYAHTPRRDARETEDPDYWIGKLFDNICGHILNLANVPPTMAGFMDRDLRTGEQWPRELAKKLATCKVFVPLYSERFFASAQCGREWYAFSRRVLNHAARVGEVDAIIPALWTPPLAESSLPIVAQGIQFEHRALNETYGSQGFYKIMKLKRYADDYEEATLGLAERIIHVAKNQSVRMGTTTKYDELENAFADVQGDVPGRKRVRFTVVAPSESELTGGRSPNYYGSTPGAWNPYAPESRVPLAVHAAGLAQALSFHAEISDIEEDEEQLLAEGAPWEPQVLLIDPWAIMHIQYRRILAHFDRMTKPWVQLVIVWNSADQQLAVAKTELLTALRDALPTKLQAGRAISRKAVTGVPSLEDFGMVLSPVVAAAARQYLKDLTMRPPEG